MFISALLILSVFTFQSPQALLDLGKRQLQEGRPAEARASLEAAIRADPKLFDAYVLLSRVAQDTQDWKGLIDAGERLARLNPVDYPIAFISQAVGHRNLGDSSAAERHLRTAQQIDPEHRFPQSWQLLGVLLAERGDYAGAASQWRVYLQHAPASRMKTEFEARLATVTALAAKASEAETPTFRAEAELALLRFRILPKRGLLIPALGKEDIEILEDGVPQKIALLEGGRSSPRNIPLEISLLFDASGSVRSSGNLDPHVFSANLLDEYPNASIAIFGFSEQLVRFTGPTRHHEVLKQAMDAVMNIPPAGTPLFRSITDTIRWPGQRPGATRMLVVFSDGESYSRDDFSYISRAVQAAQECGVAIYPVQLQGPRGSATPSAMQTMRDLNPGAPAWRPTATIDMSIREFAGLAHQTGGEDFGAFSSTDVLPRILKALARHVELGYVAGYYPVSNGRATRRRVEVVLKSKQLGTLKGGKRILVH